MSTSVWKREIHLRRPRTQIAAPAPAADREQPTATVKRGRLFRKRVTLAVPVVPAPATSAAAEFAELARSSPRIAKLLEEAHAAAGSTPALPPVSAAAIETPAQIDEPAFESEPEPESGRDLEAAFRAATAPDPDPDPDFDAEPEPEPESESEPEPEPEPAIEPKPDPEPALLPAAATEPVAEIALEKVPLLKRELRLRRPKSQETLEPKVAPEPTVEAAAPAKPEKVPLLKRELRLRRAKGESTVAPGPIVKTAGPTKVETEKVPLLKRQLHLPRPSRREGHGVEDIVGLRIGSSQLAAARVVNNGSRELVQLARTELAPGIVVAGEVREPEELAKAVKTFFASNKLPRRGVRLGVASSRIGVRVLEVPRIDDPRQLENAIRFKAHEAIPIPVADAVLDHVAIGDGVDDNGLPVRRVLVAFAHRDLVTRHADACRKAGIRLHGIDLEGFALLRALSAPADGEPATRAVVVIAIGHDRTVFAVSDGLVCEFTRVLEWGGSSLDAALTRALDLAPEEATAVKHSLSLNAGDGADGGLSPVQAEAARAAIRDELGVLGRELVASLNFYQTRPGSLDLGELLVTGGGAQVPGLLEELERVIGVPVRAGDPLARVTLGKKVRQPADAGSFAVAVGLGIER